MHLLIVASRFFSQGHQEDFPFDDFEQKALWLTTTEFLLQFVTVKI